MCDVGTPGVTGERRTRTREWMEVKTSAQSKGPVGENQGETSAERAVNVRETRGKSTL